MSVTTPDTPAPSFERLVTVIGQAHAELAAQASRAVNASLTLRNWLIGFHIAEYELQGTDRAQYGDKLIERLAERLLQAGVSRTEARELRRYRQFYLTYPQIRESLTPELAKSFLPQEGAERAEPALVIRDPYVFEFLGLTPQEVMGESHLEDQLLDKLHDFLIELGHGFCFEARQKRVPNWQFVTRRVANRRCLRHASPQRCARNCPGLLTDCSWASRPPSPRAVHARSRRSALVHAPAGATGFGALLRAPAGQQDAVGRA